MSTETAIAGIVWFGLVAATTLITLATQSIFTRGKRRNGRRRETPTAPADTPRP